MTVRMPFPDDVNPDPDAMYPRSLAEAFPHDPQITPMPKRKLIPNRPTAWLIATLMVLICLTLTGCSSAEAQEPSASAADQRQADSSAQACPPGQHVEWVDGTTMQCLKYLQ
jgi:hypothetical protein